jgi:hypothetical protein
MPARPSPKKDNADTLASIQYEILLFMFQRQNLCFIFIINEPRLLSREGRALSYSSTPALKQLARENSHKHLIAYGDVRFHALGLFLFRLSVFAYFLLPDLCAL